MEVGWEMELQDLAHAAAMSEEQLRQIMGFYGNDVWHYIYYLTKSADIADDLAQEVFIKCFYRIGTYRGSSSFRAWLFTIARNTVFSYRKSRFFRSGFWGGVQAIRNNEPADNRDGWSDELPGTARSAEMEYLGNRRTDEIWSIIMQEQLGKKLPFVSLERLQEAEQASVIFRTGEDSAAIWISTVTGAVLRMNMNGSLLPAETDKDLIPAAKKTIQEIGYSGDFKITKVQRFVEYGFL